MSLQNPSLSIRVKSLHLCPTHAACNHTKSLKSSSLELWEVHLKDLHKQMSATAKGQTKNKRNSLNQKGSDTTHNKPVSMRTPRRGRGREGKNKQTGEQWLRLSSTLPLRGPCWKGSDFSHSFSLHQGGSHQPHWAASQHLETLAGNLRSLPTIHNGSRPATTKYVLPVLFQQSEMVIKMRKWGGGQHAPCSDILCRSPLVTFTFYCTKNTTKEQ